MQKAAETTGKYWKNKEKELVEPCHHAEKLYTFNTTTFTLVITTVMSETKHIFFLERQVYFLIFFFVDFIYHKQFTNINGFASVLIYVIINKLSM